MKNVDLLPQRYVDRLTRRRYRRRNLLWSLTVLGALGLLYLMTDARIRAASARLAEYQEEQELQERTQTRWEALRYRKAELQRQSDVIDRVDDDAPVDLVMAELSGFLNEAMAIRAIELERVEDDTAHLAALAEQDASESTRTVTRVRLEGVAPSDVDIGMFYGKLSASPLFEKVELRYTRERVEANRVMRAFEVCFRIVAINVSRSSTKGFEAG